MRILIALLALAPTLALAAPGKAELTGDLKFVSDAPVEKIVGTATPAGTVTVDLADLSTLQAEIKVPVTTMKTGNEQRDEHMLGDQWLDAKAFPDIVFQSTAITVTKPITGEEVKEAEVEITGNFTLHGVTTVLKAPATLKWKENKLKVTTRFQVKLADYAIKGREGVVGSKVGSTIDLDVTLKGVIQ